MWKGKGTRELQKMGGNKWEKVSVWPWGQEDTLLRLAQWLVKSCLDWLWNCSFPSVSYFSRPLFVILFSFGSSMFSSFPFYKNFIFNFLSPFFCEIVWVSNKRGTFCFPKSDERQWYLLQVEIGANTHAICTTQPKEGRIFVFITSDFAEAESGYLYQV